MCAAKWVHVPASGAVWLPYGKTTISLYMPDEKSAPEIAFQGVVPIYSSKLQKLVPSTASKALTEWVEATLTKTEPDDAMTKAYGAFVRM